MRRPSAVWGLFGVGLVAVLSAMSWLTVKTLQLDRAEALARLQAEQEEQIGRALWRMDALLTPILAQEAARSDVVYRPIIKVNQGKGATAAELSPLLSSPPDFVLLHFACPSNGTFTSPQVPSGLEAQIACDQGVPPESIEASRKSLDELKQAVNRDELLSRLPQEMVPDWASNPELNSTNYLYSNGVNAPNSGFDNNGNIGQVVQSAPVRGLNTNGRAGGNDTQLAPDIIDNNSGKASGNGTNTFVPFQNANPPPQAEPQTNTVNSNDYDLANRSSQYQNFTQRMLAQERRFNKDVVVKNALSEGICRPVWIEGRLLFARRVQAGQNVMVQGCWFNWEALRARLRSEIADIFPDCKLVPADWDSDAPAGRVLATLPIKLVVSSPRIQLGQTTPIHWALCMSWASVLLAAVAAALTLSSVVALSERRAAFVAAVTHELRTPLTTFRMYAEMLALGMVPSAERRQEYLETLRVEADRLSHLVDNVLQYARLERGGPNAGKETVVVSDLVQRIESRLADRARQAGLDLSVTLPIELAGKPVETNPTAVEQILFNLIDNACKYAAATSDKRIGVSLTAGPGVLNILVEDHGPGLTPAARTRLFRPFSKSVHEAARTAPGVGLGLALCRRLAADLGGRLTLVRTDSTGTMFCLSLPCE